MRALVQSLPRRKRDVIAQEGASTKYERAGGLQMMDKENHFDS